MSNQGVWVKVHPDYAGGGAPGAALIGGHNGATVETGKVIDGKTYDIYTFTDDTDLNLSLTVDTAGSADVLIIGGGGGAGGNISTTGAAGGGGAGEVFEGTDWLDAGTYDIDVGSGGDGGVSPTSGKPTTFGSLHHCAGGGHGGPDYGVNGFGRPGACGGGGSGAGSIEGGEGLQSLGKNFGYSGGTAGPNAYTCGGGGGWTSAGQNSPAANKGGNGGAGIVSKISGLNVEYAGGGGGGCHSAGGEGSGSHRGGNGNPTGTAGEDAEANSGSGGGGGGGTGIGGGKGGSGIVIVRVEV